MTRIGLISDTHGYLDEAVFHHFEACDQVWHAGDFGSMEIASRLEVFRPLTGVYGNIDDPTLRSKFPLDNHFLCDGARVFMRHIGGYPGRYAPGVKKIIQEHRPAIFISGHSHILKVMYDQQLQCLHLNPGAAGNQGWHTVRTLLRFSIDKGNITNCEVIELGPRGK